MDNLPIEILFKILSLLCGRPRQSGCLKQSDLKIIGQHLSKARLTSTSFNDVCHDILTQACKNTTKHKIYSRHYACIYPLFSTIEKLTVYFQCQINMEILSQYPNVKKLKLCEQHRIHRLSYLTKLEHLTILGESHLSPWDLQKMTWLKSLSVNLDTYHGQAEIQSFLKSNQRKNIRRPQRISGVMFEFS